MRRKKYVILLIVVCMALFFVGCDSGKTEATPTPVMATPTVAPTPTQAPTPTPERTAKPTKEPGVAAGGIESEDPYLHEIAESSDGNVPIQMTDLIDLGIRFYATTDFTQVQLHCPSWEKSDSGFTAKLYKWDSDYDTTIEGTSVAEQVFANYQDNAWLEFNFDEMPEGDYLVLMTEPTGEPTCQGIWKYPETMDNIECYKEGIEEEGTYQTKIQYVRTPVNKLGTLD